jgi:hypothetical protein
MYIWPCQFTVPSQYTSGSAKIHQDDLEEVSKTLLLLVTILWGHPVHKVRLKSLHFVDSARYKLKGTVSPDIGLYFRFWKFKLVLSAGPLLVFTFFYFIIPEIFKN